VQRYPQLQTTCLSLRDGSVFIENQSTRVSDKLNELELLVCELLDGEHAIRDIAREIASRHHLEQTVSLAAVIGFVDKLAQMECLIPDPPSV
jgi:hypothetical protein